MILGINLMQYIMLFLGSVFIIAWLMLYVKYNRQFDNIIKSIAKNEFFMSELFFIGFGVMKLFKYNLKSSRVKEKTKKIAEIKGNSYANYYYFVITGGKFTYLFTLLPVSFFIGAISNNNAIFFLSIMTIVILVVYLDLEIDSAISKRRDKLLNDFPRILSKLALLLNAGMTLRASWINVSNSGDGVLYVEMKATNDEIANGMTEIEAYKNFAERCTIKEIRKFTYSLIQNLQKGNVEITNLIREMADDSWQYKKYNVKIRGELASSKLMIPVSLMLIAILVMIIIPIFSSL